MRMRAVPAARHTHSQNFGLRCLRAGGGSLLPSQLAMYCTGQDVSSACATAACPWRRAMAASSASHRCESRRRPCDSVDSGTRSPSASRSRATATCGRNSAYTCTRHQAHTLKPSWVGPSRAAGAAITGRAAAQPQTGR